MNHIFSISRTLLFVVLVMSANTLLADVKLPQIFSSNMVLQRDKPVPIWGWANPNEEIKVSFVGKNYSVKANTEGKWEVLMEAVSFGGPYVLKINELVLDNILIGDVFLCSGQSNMAFLLQNSDDAERAIASAENQNIRLFNVPRDIEFKPLVDIAGKTSWQLCNPKTVKSFSAVAYYMARKLQKDLNIPIGLVHSSYGGTVIEAFISAKPLDTIARLKPVLEKIGDKNVADFIAGNISEYSKKYNNVSQKISSEVLWDTINPVVPEYNNRWETMRLPTLWEKAGLASVDGVIWFYKEVNLTKEDCQKDAFLSLGRIADQSVTFFNGEKLGSSIDSRDFIRDYSVSKHILKPGINKIMVRVANKGRNGGLWGPEELQYFKTGNGVKMPLSGEWAYKVQDMRVAVHPNDVSSSIFNAMIHPLKTIQYKGVIWYQGESSANWANEYEGLLKMMIKDWRLQFNQPNLPFVIIQLPNYKDVSKQPEVNSTWALLREAQEKATQLPNVGLVNIIDLGLADDIHPTQKTPVGERVALKLEQMLYHKKIVADGPTFKKVKFKNGQAVIAFDHADNLYMNKESVRSNFIIAGKDQKFVWAQSKLVGDRFVVWSENVKDPVAVRYAWADNPGTNSFYNGSDLPMAPFRTDNWEIVTKDIPR